jgi:type VI secretion system protein ImpF
MPDLTSVMAITAVQRAAIGRLLESIIARFEPRLRDIKATLLEPGQEVQRAVKFRVEARLNVDPAPEVAFDTILELTTGHSTITRSEG